MANVLVTDGDERAALAVARSLGRAGHTVFVCASRRRSLAGVSRYARPGAPVPDPLERPRAYVETLRGLIRDRHVEVLIPITEAALRAILPLRTALGEVVLPFPDAEAFDRVSDKAIVADAARTLGIPAPAETRVRSPTEVGHVLRGAHRFPLVLKPGRSVVRGAECRAEVGVTHVHDRAELASALAAVPPGAFPVLLQERIVGPGAGVFVLLWEGRLRAAFAHRRIREKPPSGGVSVYRESVPVDRELLHRSCALLNRFGWRGVAMVEYKVDARSGTPYLMEVNGRFWGSLQLAIDAGVDFPRLLVDAATGDVRSTPTPYRVGVRSRWWWGDVDHVIARMRRSPRSLSLPDDAPGRWRTLAHFLASFGPGTRGEVFRLDDPRPALRETLDWIRGR